MTGTVEVEKILQTSGAIQKGHFLLTSGLHSPTYCEKFRILQHPNYTDQLCWLIAQHFRDQRLQLVAGPTTGGIILAYEVAKQLHLQSVFAERLGEKRTFRQGFTITPGERVLVVDDVLTTGGSVQEVIDELRRRQAEVIGVGVLIDRSEGKANFGVPLFSCYKLKATTYHAKDCPLCAQGIPLIKPSIVEG